MNFNSPEKSRKKSARCLVCGDAAQYMYFGTLACQACKMFFKRYGNNQQKVPSCSFHGQCEINLSTRHVCTPCRLQKCLSAGMQVEKIRHSNQVHQKKTETKTKFLSKRQTDTSSSVPVTKSLCVILDNLPSMTSANWRLLSSLTNAYDLSNVDAYVHHFNDIPYPKELSLIRSIHLAAPHDFISRLHQTAAVVWQSNRDFQALQSSDRSLLLSTAVNNITCFLISYIFAQHNLCHNPLFLNHLVHLYGPVIVQYHHQTSSLAVVDDPIVFKLFLALFALCSTSRMNQSDSLQEFIDPKSIMDIEHRYAEVTWKYLIYKYNHDEATRRFMRMIRWLLSISVLAHQIHDVKKHRNDIEETVEDVEMNMILDDMNELNS